MEERRAQEKVEGGWERSGEGELERVQEEGVGVRWECQAGRESSGEVTQPGKGGRSCRGKGR